MRKGYLHFKLYPSKNLYDSNQLWNSEGKIAFEYSYLLHTFYEIQIIFQRYIKEIFQGLCRELHRSCEFDFQIEHARQFE